MKRLKYFLIFAATFSLGYFYLYEGFDISARSRRRSAVKRKPLPSIGERATVAQFRNYLDKMGDFYVATKGGEPITAQQVGTVMPDGYTGARRMGLIFDEDQIVVLQENSKLIKALIAGGRIKKKHAAKATRLISYITPQATLKGDPAHIALYLNCPYPPKIKRIGRKTLYPAGAMFLHKYKNK